MRCLIFVILLFLTTSCSTVRVARREHWRPVTFEGSSSYQAPNTAFGVSSPATTTKRKTICIYGWGFAQRNIDCPDCLPGTLAEVRISNHLGFQLLSVLSLGFFQFQIVEWRCAKQPQIVADEF